MVPVEICCFNDRSRPPRKMPSLSGLRCKASALMGVLLAAIVLPIDQSATAATQPFSPLQQRIDILRKELHDYDMLGNFVKVIILEMSYLHFMHMIVELKNTVLVRQKLQIKILINGSVFISVLFVVERFFA